MRAPRIPPAAGGGPGGERREAEAGGASARRPGLRSLVKRLGAPPTMTCLCPSSPRPRHCRCGLTLNARRHLSRSGSAPRAESRVPASSPSAVVPVSDVPMVPGVSCPRLGAAASAACSPPPAEGFQSLSETENGYALKIESGALHSFSLSKVYNYRSPFDIRGPSVGRFRLLNVHKYTSPFDICSPAVGQSCLRSVPGISVPPSATSCRMLWCTPDCKWVGEQHCQVMGILCNGESCGPAALSYVTWY